MHINNINGWVYNGALLWCELWWWKICLWNLWNRFIFRHWNFFFHQIFESFKILKGFASTDWKVHFPAQCNIHLIHTHYATTVITKKLWNRKTTLSQYLSVFDVVTKQIVLPDTFNHKLSKMGLFTLHNCFIPCIFDYLKS